MIETAGRVRSLLNAQHEALQAQQRSLDGKAAHVANEQEQLAAESSRVSSRTRELQAFVGELEKREAQLRSREAALEGERRALDSRVAELDARAQEMQLEREYLNVKERVVGHEREAGGVPGKSDAVGEVAEEWNARLADVESARAALAALHAQLESERRQLAYRRSVQRQGQGASLVPGDESQADAEAPQPAPATVREIQKLSRDAKRRGVGG